MFSYWMVRSFLARF